MSSTFSLSTRLFGYDGNLGTSPSKGRKLTAQEMDYSLLYLEELSQSSGQGPQGDQGFQGATGPQGDQGFQGATGPQGSGSSITSITYNELSTLISEESLNPGSFYEISNFQTCYDQPDYDNNGDPIMDTMTFSNYRQGPVEPIVVLAISENNISDIAFSPEYPYDKIRYDRAWNSTEITGLTAYGRITERIDEKNNRTDYDHRNIKFKRYLSHEIEDTQDGWITSIYQTGLTASVTGATTSFTSLTVGDVILIRDAGFKIYKITEINSDTEMVVEGRTYYDYSDTAGSIFFTTSTQFMVTDGSIYYFSDEGDSGSINDGGNDMYDGGNTMNTSAYLSEIPYTHTQQTETNDGGTYSFAMDGVVVTNDIFGTNSSYFTNMYSGLFACSAYNIDIESFSINGNVGADGSGNMDIFEYSTGTWSLYSKRIYNAGDPSVNHIIIINTDGSGVTHNYSEDTDNDYDELTGIGNATQIHYLLMALGGGVKITDQEIIDIFNEYILLVDSDINTTLSNLNSNYINLTGVLPQQEFVPISHEYRMSNIIGEDDQYHEKGTFENITAYNNYIGDILYEYEEPDFILSNNIFSDTTVDNRFGQCCINNTFANRTSNNTADIFFVGNKILEDFRKNKIGPYFESNNIYYDFDDNIVDISFENNLIMDDFEDNTIGSYFTDNKIYCYFYNNTIKSLFQSNYIDIEEFTSNDIDHMKSNNITGEGFNNNIIRGTFLANNISGWFEYNSTETFFIGNNVYTDFQYNTIGPYFASNTINDPINYNDFRNNNICNNFQSYDLTTLDGSFGGNPIFYSQTTADVVFDNYTNGFMVLFYSSGDINPVIMQNIILY